MAGSLPCVQLVAARNRLAHETKAPQEVIEGPAAQHCKRIEPPFIENWQKKRAGDPRH